MIGAAVDFATSAKMALLTGASTCRSFSPHTASAGTSSQRSALRGSMRMNSDIHGLEICITVWSASIPSVASSGIG